MNLDARVDDQINALQTWMRTMAHENETPPSLEMWKEFTEGLIERADFLDRYVQPKVVRMLNGERLTLRSPTIAPLVPSSSLGNEVTPRDDAESTSQPFLPKRPDMLSS